MTPQPFDPFASGNTSVPTLGSPSGLPKVKYGPNTGEGVAWMTICLLRRDTLGAGSVLSPLAWWWEVPRGPTLGAEASLAH